MPECDNQNSLINLESGLFLESTTNKQINILLKILESIQGYILVVDKDSKIVYINPEYFNTFGLKREQLIGRFLSDIEPLALVHKVLKTGKPMRGTVSHLFSLKIDCIADMVPLYIEDKLIGMVASFKNANEIIEVHRELQHFKALSDYLQRELNRQEELSPAFSKISGRSKSLLEVLRVAAYTADTDATVLIRGESGVGKEGLAEAIHYSSKRSKGPYIKVNCAAIPESLLESELFGYEEGAFTGAKLGGRIGKFELANGGTLFLDEIGDMSLVMQAKLLRVLQDKVIERVGGNKQIKLNLRIIAATNRNLDEMIEKSQFRQDLFYRLNVVSLLLPSLRERKEDIPLLVSIFLEDMRKLYNKQITFSAEAITGLTEYSWPGNIRELRNVIERIVITCKKSLILPEDLPIILEKNNDERRVSEGSLKLKLIIENAEREAISTALRLSGNNKSRAMEMLGLSRRGLYLKMHKYNLD